MNACPKKAIHMEPDRQGFLYPVINTVKCVDCGLCKRSCQIGKARSAQNKEPSNCFGVKNSDSIRAVSSSGGVFTAFLDKFIIGGGIAVGAVFDSEMNVAHKMASTQKECDAFRGSKYVQSDMGTIYKEVADILSNGQRLLFSGTPCQVAGLKEYLKAHRVDMTGFLTVDLVCHGAPSPKIWADYLSTLEKKYHSSINVFKYMDYMNAVIYTILKSQLGGRYGKDCYKNHINSG